jgi:plasmid stabilization system protein ParE
MLPIRWSPLALHDLETITSYVAERNPKAAEALHERIESSVLPASGHPYLFRPVACAAAVSVVR